MIGQQDCNENTVNQRISALSIFLSTSMVAATYEDQSVSYSTAQNDSVGLRSATILCRRSTSRKKTEAHRLAFSSACSCLTSFSSSKILPKWSCTKRTLTLLLVLLIIVLPANLVHSATFFYGATDESQNSPVPGTGSSSGLSKYSSANKLSEDDLKSVYSFCSLLPLLESTGKIERNDQSREICEKLIVMLQPMFAKRKNPTSIFTKERRNAYGSDDDAK